MLKKLCLAPDSRWYCIAVRLLFRSSTQRRPPRLMEHLRLALWLNRMVYVCRSPSRPPKSLGSIRGSVSSDISGSPRRPGAAAETIVSIQRLWICEGLSKLFLSRVLSEEVSGQRSLIRRQLNSCDFDGIRSDTFATIRSRYGVGTNA